MLKHLCQPFFQLLGLGKSQLSESECLGTQKEHSCSTIYDNYDNWYVKTKRPGFILTTCISHKCVQSETSG